MIQKTDINSRAGRCQDAGVACEKSGQMRGIDLQKITVTLPGNHHQGALP
jgi:hypothetical protein